MLGQGRRRRWDSTMGIILLGFVIMTTVIGGFPDGVIERAASETLSQQDGRDWRLGAQRAPYDLILDG
jgi:hypothetical protein